MKQKISLSLGSEGLPHVVEDRTKPRGIPVPWLVKREVPLKEGDIFYSRVNGKFSATKRTVDFIREDFYQEDLILVGFLCSREGEFDALYEMWESETSYLRSGL
jgi:hypothetical protein